MSPTVSCTRKSPWCASGSGAHFGLAPGGLRDAKGWR
jgi:hypothetical protein